MNAKQLADALNGIDYSECARIGRGDLIEKAKAAGLVVAYGYSDDLIEFEGAISDEAGAPDTILVDSNGILPNFLSIKDDEDECARYFERKKSARSIRAVWLGEVVGAAYAWELVTDIPHEIFGIIDEGEGFSRGIVFALSDLARREDAAGCCGKCHS